MKLINAILLFFICWGTMAFGQVKTINVGFKEDKSNIQRRAKEDVLHKVMVISTTIDTAIFKNYKVSVVTDSSASTLLLKYVSILKKVEKESILPNSNEYVYELRFTAETENEIKRNLILKLKIFDSSDNEIVSSLNSNKNLTHEITIFPSVDTIKNYSFLGYLGTNFDLVDGIKTKNLFFAVNAFIPETKKWGINVGLYGNRTMTRTDTSKAKIFTSKIVSLGDTTMLYFRDSATQVTTRVSDNLGATFSPLIPIKFLTDNNLKFYYAPQFEMIWRRSTIEETYQNNYTYKIDSIKRSRPLGGSTLTTPLTNKFDLNIYDVYLGVIGFLLKYETSDISFRLSASVGWSYSYTPIGALSSSNLRYSKEENKFFFSRLWLTEPSTGVTLGAEVSNYFGDGNALPYYNVTLSKAFNFKSLAAFLKPLN